MQGFPYLGMVRTPKHAIFVETQVDAVECHERARGTS